MSVKKFAPVILSAVLLVTALAARAYSENGEVKPVSTSTMDTATNDNAKVEQNERSTKEMRGGVLHRT